jgi:DNA polymerase-3 subunit delta'
MDVIGHASVLQFLENARVRERVSHAYLFVGPLGVGKSTIAARFVRDLIGQTTVGASLDVWAGLRSHPDFLLVEREEDEKKEKQKKNISIEQIHEVRERLSRGAFLDSWKIAVISEADTLSIAAANALLKTLEEPSGKSLLILLAEKIGGVPATVRSRCQVIRCNLVEEREIRDGLLRRGAAAEQAESLACRAAGRPGTALRFFADPARAAEEEVHAAAFIAMLGAPVWQRLQFAERAVPGKDAPDAVFETGMLLRLWENILRDAMMVAAGEPGFVHWFSFRDRIAQWAGKKTLAGIVQSLRAVRESRAALRENVAPRLVLEHVLLHT